MTGTLIKIKCAGCNEVIELDELQVGTKLDCECGLRIDWGRYSAAMVEPRRRRDARKQAKRDAKADALNKRRESTARFYNWRFGVVLAVVVTLTVVVVVVTTKTSEKTQAITAVPPIPGDTTTETKTFTVANADKMLISNGLKLKATNTPWGTLTMSYTLDAGDIKFDVTVLNYSGNIDDPLELVSCGGSGPRGGIEEKRLVFGFCAAIIANLINEDDEVIMLVLDSLKVVNDEGLHRSVGNTTTPAGWKIQIVYYLEYNESTHALLIVDATRKEERLVSPVGPLEIEATEFAYDVTERNESWHKYAWIATINNPLDSQVTITITVNFLDAKGFIVDSGTEYGTISANTEETFRGVVLVNAEIAPNIASAEVRGSTH